MIANLFSTPTNTGFLFYPGWHLLHWGRNDDIIGEDIEDINVHSHSSSLSPPRIKMANQSLRARLRALLDNQPGLQRDKSMGTFLDDEFEEGLVEVLEFGLVSHNDEKAGVEEECRNGGVEDKASGLRWLLALVTLPLS